MRDAEGRVGLVACGMCGGAAPTPKYEVTFTDGSTRVYLTETEARIAATAAGGGHVRVIRP